MITLICGRPRAGKTTYSKRFENVIHLDDSRFRSLEDRYDWVLDRICGMKGDVVIDGIYSTPEQRKKLLHSYSGTGSKCIWIDTDINIISQRYGVFKRPPYPFTAPSYDEGWDEIIVIKEK